MKNKGVMISLAAILVIGILITKGTYGFIERNSSGFDMAAQITEDRAGRVEIEADESVKEAGPELAAALDQEEETEEETSGQDMNGIQMRAPLSDSVLVDGDNFPDTKEIRESPAGSPVMEEGQEEYKEEILIEEDESPRKSISPLDTVPAEEEADLAIQKKSEKAVLSAESQSYYKKRLQDLDIQILKSRESQEEPNVNSSARSAASNELKLWDSELNAIYNAILERLNRERSELLAAEQRAWMKDRDSLAMEAAKNSAGGSSESIEYTVSLIESTRLRAYELVEEYEEELKE